jgi:hypothetical protein
MGEEDQKPANGKVMEEVKKIETKSLDRTMVRERVFSTDQ